MDNPATSGDLYVIRETVVHLHTLAIANSKRGAEIERHVRDIKAGVAILLVAVLAIDLHLATR
jgi:hypothetical protein